MTATNRLSLTANPLTQDFHSGKDSTFLADVPNGTYDIAIGLGDRPPRMIASSVWAEGQPLAANVTTKANQFEEVRVA